jgi:hypothetical protein
MDRAKDVEQCFVDSGLGSDGCAALQHRAYDVWLYIGLTQGFRASADRFVPSDALLAKVEVAGSIPVVRSTVGRDPCTVGGPGHWCGWNADQTNGECPCSVVHGWKWSEIDTRSKR